MGCDIHLYREKKISGKWVTADRWEDEYNDGIFDVPYKERFTDRDYDLFGLLSEGVRRDHPFSWKGRGVPFNVSSQVKKIIDNWEGDGHSHSYLYLFELEEMWDYLCTRMVTVSGMKDKEGLEKFLESLKSDNPDYDLLYPFCQWASNERYVEFEVSLPARYKLSGLKKLIDLFKDMDGDNHRIVFFFDN